MVIKFEYIQMQEIKSIGWLFSPNIYKAFCSVLIKIAIYMGSSDGK